MNEAISVLNGINRKNNVNNMTCEDANLVSIVIPYVIEVLDLHSCLIVMNVILL
jgi:hypothetical protein